MFGVATKHPPLKLELAFDFNIGDNYGQHFFVNIDTPLVAKRKSGSLAGTERLMEEVCELENIKPALQRVKANKGSPGVVGMTVEDRDSTMAKEVSRIQLHWRTRTSAAHRSQGHCPL